MAYSEAADKLLSLSRREKRFLAVSVDTVICLWTVFAAYYLRLEEWVWPEGAQWLAVVVAPFLAIPIFIKGGLYRAIFRHTGWPAMIAVTRACLIYGAVYAIIFTFISFPGVPRTVGIIQPVLLFLAIAAIRAVTHYLLGGSYRQIVDPGGSRNVLIYGAGAAGRQLAAAVGQGTSMRVAAFVDDDRSLQGASLNGIMIHSPDAVLELVDRLNVSDVLLAVPSASRRRRREILDLLRPASVSVRTLPGLLDLAHGRIEISELRPVEIEDLLGRDSVAPIPELLEENVTGKVVLVTGGGGSIGSELCRQLLDLRPSALIVADISEYALYTIHSELELREQRSGSSTPIIPLLASVLDEARMDAILSRWKPSTIYHAAAYKHVPLVEQNVLEGIKNNVFGTKALARLAVKHEVEDFVLVSTDKAVRPANVMGASKRLAEMILQALAAEKPRVRFSMVRFGNVLGSSGSVVPLFRQQISNGGPITVTDPEVTRYFMTIPEAAQLVIQAGAMGSGGEVFVLDMGEPVKVYDLAMNMIELSGLSCRDKLNPDGDIEIAIIGLRPGEKLYEELLIGEDPMTTAHGRIMQAREKFIPLPELEPQLGALSTAVRAGDVTKAIEILKALVPEYRASGDVVDWLTACPLPGTNPMLGQPAIAIDRNRGDFDKLGESRPAATGALRYSTAGSGD